MRRVLGFTGMASGEISGRGTNIGAAYALSAQCGGAKTKAVASGASRLMSPSNATLLTSDHPTKALVVDVVGISGTPSTTRFQMRVPNQVSTGAVPWQSPPQHYTLFRTFGAYADVFLSPCYQCGV